MYKWKWFLSPANNTLHAAVFLMTSLGNLHGTEPVCILYNVRLSIMYNVRLSIKKEFHHSDSFSHA